MHLEVTGTIEEIVFSNEENGFIIAILEAEGEQFYIKGYMPMIAIGDYVTVQGRYTTHKVYGEQIEVDKVHITVPKGQEEILKYLSSGAIFGVKKATAELLVTAFGEDVFEVIQNQPEKLLSIPGIGPKKMDQIVQSYQEQIASKEIIMFFQKYGISLNLASKIFKFYGDSAIEEVSENPYRLSEDIQGIGFMQADKIARAMGIEASSPFRIMSGIKFILKRETSFGHTYMEKEALFDFASREMQIDKALMMTYLPKMIIEGDLKIEKIMTDQEVVKEMLYLPSLHFAENHVAFKLNGLASHTPEPLGEAVEELLDEYETSRGICLADRQKEAIKGAVSSGAFVVTGGPGTGKTTIINCIIEIFERFEKKVLLAAPTGRAAKRMSEATLREAKTIHRLLEFQGGQDQYDSGFMKNEYNPLEADVVIIDEVSMIDIVLMYRLLDAIEYGVQVIFVGDANQLPSVGPGNVLGDILEAKTLPVVALNEIYRQAKTSMIVTNAHKINAGEMPELNVKDKDFFFITKVAGLDIAKEIALLCQKRLPDYYGVDPIKDIQVLAPVKKGEVGVVRLNEILQQALNPSSDKKSEKTFQGRIFREGDKVMQIKNNYEISWQTQQGEDGKGVFNGDIGYVTDVDDKLKVVVVCYEDRYVDYTYGEMDQLIHAYACTVHKSQGSEFPVVVMPVTFGPSMLMSRNILYTAVTRAKTLVVLVGQKKYLKQMVDNVKEMKRQSLLKERLQNYHQEE